jgi:hypothetical protein
VNLVAQEIEFYRGTGVVHRGDAGKNLAQAQQSLDIFVASFGLPREKRMSLP